MVMRVFVAGSGVSGRRLVPQLVARGHQVTDVGGQHKDVAACGPDVQVMMRQPARCLPLWALRI
jgi:nucleoside-diphosphate-sugar epimerase